MKIRKSNGLIIHLIRGSAASTYPPVAIIATPKAKCLPEVERWYLGAARAAEADLRGKLEEPIKMECGGSCV